MKIFINNVICVIVLFLISIIYLDESFCGRERFIPEQGGNTEVWRITNDPTVRDWANYHNTDAWSPDGRYICYTHFASDGKEFGVSYAKEIHIYDFFEDKDIFIDNGSDPRWANNHNWLFYIRIRKDDENKVMWLDVDNNKLTQIATGVTSLGETDYKDEWIFGGVKLSKKPQDVQVIRIRIQPNSIPEIL